MAPPKDDEDWRDRQERRRTEDVDQKERDKKRGKVAVNEKQELRDSLFGAGEDKFEELMLRAEPAIDRLNSLYNTYFSGVEKRPPTEARKQLDQTMYTLQLITKPTSTAAFRYNGVIQKYMAFTQRWDKRLREIEDGKIKLRLGSDKKKIGSF